MKALEERIARQRCALGPGPKRPPARKVAPWRREELPGPPPPRGEAQPSEGPGDWRRYAWAAGRALAPRLPARPRGLVGRLEGSLPGGGLSSSASLLLALLTALGAANERELEPRELIALARRAENGAPSPPPSRISLRAPASCWWSRRTGCD